MTEAKSDFGRGDRGLTIAFLAPPLIWFAYFTTAYTLVPTACSSGSRLLLHGLTAAALVLLAVSGLFSWRRVALYGAAQTNTGDARHTRRRFMAIVGTVFALAFALAVIAVEIPIAILRDCA